MHSKYEFISDPITALLGNSTILGFTLIRSILEKLLKESCHILSKQIKIIILFAYNFMNTVPNLEILFDPTST
jgi:hypothetical protein